MCPVSHVTCHISGVRCQMSDVTCHVACVMCLVSCVMCLVSCVLCYASYVIYIFFYKVAELVGRLCYQQGLPQNFFKTVCRSSQNCTGTILLELSSEGLFIQLEEIFCCWITLICITIQQCLKPAIKRWNRRYANNYMFMIGKPSLLSG